MLEYLERSNLFVISLDGERRWYRYHHLFADLLRQRLQREQGALVPKLHRRASKWYADRGWMPDAVHHALAAQDSIGASELIEQAAWAMLTRGEFAMLLGWLKALPDALVRSRPRLKVLCAWSLTLTGQLEDAESYLPSSPESSDDPGVQGEVAAIRAHIAGLRDDGRRAIEIAHQAFEHLPSGNPFLRGYLALNLGLARWRSGDMIAGSRAIKEAIALGHAANSPYLTLVATARLGHVQEMQGLLGEALVTHQAALQLAAEQGDRPVPYAGVAHVGIAEVLYEQNDLESALSHATEGIHLCERGGISSYMLAGRFILAQLAKAQGDVEAALQTLQAAEQLAEQYDYVYLLAEQAELRARLQIAQGKLQAASQWVERRRPISVEESTLTIAREMELLTVARVRIAQGLGDPRATGNRNKFGQAQRLLTGMLKAAEAAGRAGSAIRIRVLQARLFQTRGDLDQALSALGRAFILAEPEGYVRTFVDEGEPMAALLRQALSRGIAPDYAARLLAAFDQEAEPTPPGMDALVEPLTEREMDVLRLIAAGLSNPEIADELVIAVSTVKSHVNHIYGKLAADSRTRAIAKAREIGLL
jgi:LuxR family maltose regulon positive regulatory protein